MHVSEMCCRIGAHIADGVGEWQAPNKVGLVTMIGWLTRGDETVPGCGAGSEIEALDKKGDRLSTDVDHLKTDVGDFKTGVGSLKTDVAAILKILGEQFKPQG